MPEKLANIFGRLDNTSLQTVKNCQLLALWPQVVDGRVGCNTEAVKITNRTLYINTSSSVWAQELGFFKKGLISKFNSLAGEAAIVDIRFKATGGFDG